MCQILGENELLLGTNHMHTAYATPPGNLSSCVVLFLPREDFLHMLYTLGTSEFVTLVRAAMETKMSKLLTSCRLFTSTEKSESGNEEKLSHEAIIQRNNKTNTQRLQLASMCEVH